MALGMDLADPRRRGSAMATFSLSYQVGAGIGALLAGSMITLSGYRGMYLTSIGILGFGLLLAFVNWQKLASVIAVVE